MSTDDLLEPQKLLNIILLKSMRNVNVTAFQCQQ